MHCPEIWFIAIDESINPDGVESQTAADDNNSMSTYRFYMAVDVDVDVAAGTGLSSHT